MLPHSFAPIQPDPTRTLESGEPRYHSLWRPKPAGAYYDATIADAAVEFIETKCTFTGGDYTGRPFLLQDWQKRWIIREAFGWRRADGSRLYRRVILFIPRGNGKTDLLGAVANLLLLGEAVPKAELYSIATTESQAKLVFVAAKAMVESSPVLARHYEVFTDVLFVRETHARFEALTGKGRGKHGFRTTYLICDEVHEWQSDVLYSTVRKAMIKASEPMEWLISTAGVEAGYGITVWNQALAICEGAVDDSETLALIWCANQDPKAEIDLADERHWREANPNLGVSVHIDGLRRDARRAPLEANGLNEFKNYNLNIWTSQAERWLPMTAWNACTTPSTTPDVPRWREMFDTLKGRPCWGGLDIATTRDFNALVWMFPPRTDEERWHLLCRLWWPQASMNLAMQKSRIPFDLWAAAGAITITPGNVADHGAIIDQIEADCGDYDVLGLGVDRFNAHTVTQTLAARDVPVTEVRFGMLSMSGPTKSFEMKVLGTELDHGGHPALRWMASACSVRRDNNGNYMPQKTIQTTHIDGIAAAVIAEAMAGTAPPQASYLETGSLVVLR